MEPLNLLIIVAIFIATYYFFARLQKTKKQDPDFHPVAIGNETLVNETEQEFCERCFQFISRWCNKYKIPLVIAEDKRFIRITAKHRKGSVNYYIHPFFNNGKKLLKFNTRSLDEIPNEKMEVLSEFVHRINTILVFGNLYLDYDTKVFGNQLIWDVSNSELNEQQLNFYYKALEATNLRRAIFRIMNQNDSAESVAKNWPFC